MTPQVQLKVLDEQLLANLLSVAVADADPLEVMPPVDGPAGWSSSRTAAFRQFYGSRLAGFDGKNRTQMYAIILDGNVVGMIRMARREEADTVETGLWLARSARARGIGGAAVRLLLTEAARAGINRVVADTTIGNTAALNVLRRYDAVLSSRSANVHGEITLGTK